MRASAPANRSAPLHGLPVGLKDIIDTADMPTENGCALHKGRTPRADAAVVSMLRAAGAVILGKTVSTECAYYSPGKTRNPWNPEHTPWRLVERLRGCGRREHGAPRARQPDQRLGDPPRRVLRRLRLQADARARPAHRCAEAFTHARSRGFFFRQRRGPGPARRGAAGKRRRRPRYAATRAHPLPAARRRGAADPALLAFIKTPHWERTDTDTKEAFGELVEALGDRVEEVELFPSAQDLWDWQRTIMAAEMAANLEALWSAGKEKLSPQLRELMERGREVRAVDYQRALRGLAPVRESLDELFMERYDAILTAPALGTAPRGLGATGDPVFCVPWTLLGMPAITLPLMRGANGLPLGVQLVGRRGFDARLMRTARWLAGKLA
jgi:Asp-tRNA(Asn)/Glu-tRNA(Gln) amidotransferase A subunit family amidase